MRFGNYKLSAPHRSRLFERKIRSRPINNCRNVRLFTVRGFVPLPQCGRGSPVFSGPYRCPAGVGITTDASAHARMRTRAREGLRRGRCGARDAACQRGGKPAHQLTLALMVCVHWRPRQRRSLPRASNHRASVRTTGRRTRTARREILRGLINFTEPHFHLMNRNSKLL